MVAHKRAFKVALGRPEVSLVPGRLDLVDRNVNDHAYETYKDTNDDGDASMHHALEPRVSFDHHEEGGADDECKARSDVAFCTVLTTRAAHEIVLNHDFAVLILTEAEHRHVVQHRVDYATSADEVATPGDSYPKHLIDEIILNRDENSDEDGQKDEQDRVFGHNLREWLLKRHIVVESLVDEVELLLYLIGRVLLDTPDVLHLIEVTITTLDNHLSASEVRDSNKIVLFKDGPRRLRMVYDAKESRDLECVFRSVIRVCGAPHFTQNEVAIIAPIAHREKGNQVVRSRVLNDQLVVLSCRKFDEKIRARITKLSHTFEFHLTKVNACTSDRDRKGEA